MICLWGSLIACYRGDAVVFISISISSATIMITLDEEGKIKKTKRVFAMINGLMIHPQGKHPCSPLSVTVMCWRWVAIAMPAHSGVCVNLSACVCVQYQLKEVCVFVHVRSCVCMFVCVRSCVQNNLVTSRVLAYEPPKPGCFLVF